MQTKIETFKNGALVTFDVNLTNGMYTVLARNPAGEVHDKVSCDTRRGAMEYYRAFKKVVSKL